MGLIMKFVITLIAALAVFAISEELSDKTTILMDVQSSIDSLKKGGATDKDCKELADKECKEVESERTKDQLTIDRLKTGSQCVNLGIKAVQKATLHWKKVKKTHTSWKGDSCQDHACHF